MRCLVTGASGFLGSHLVSRLLLRRYCVVILVRPDSNQLRLAQSLPNVDILYTDLHQLGSHNMGQPAMIDLAAQLKGIDAVFHLAWTGVSSEFRNDPDQIRQNLASTLNLWELSRLAGCKCWIGMGSQAEYGPVRGILRHNTPAFPVTAYGVGKLAAGLATAKMSELSGMRHVWLRLLSAYGPGDDPRHMIPSVMEALLAGCRPALTLGQQLWDYLYVDDVTDALCAVLESEAVGTFNLGSGIATPLRSVVEQLRDLIDPGLPLGFGEVSYRPDQVMHLEADISPLVMVTGWKPKTSLLKGLEQTVSFIKKQTERNAQSRMTV